ncbi:hypothetical protein VKS41_008871 [Umbelopsis sp. WA50703]
MPSKLVDFDVLQIQSSGRHGKSYESINLSPDGTMVSLTFSEDSGDQTFGRIYRVSDQTLLDDHIQGIGTDQIDDILLYQNLVKPQNYVTIGMLEDKLLRYELNSKTLGMTLAYCYLKSFDDGKLQKDIKWNFVSSDENISYSFIGQSDDVLYIYFKDESQCPNGKIIGYSYATGNLEDVIEEAQDAVLHEQNMPSSTNA